MPIFLIVLGVFMLLAGFRSSEKEFLTQLWSDSKAFTPWFFLILIVGGIGYNKDLRGASNLFLFLIVLAFLLGNKGANFNKITQQFNSVIRGSKS